MVVRGVRTFLVTRLDPPASVLVAGSVLRLPSLTAFVLQHTRRQQCQQAAGNRQQATPNSISERLHNAETVNDKQYT